VTKQHRYVYYLVGVAGAMALTVGIIAAMVGVGGRASPTSTQSGIVSSPTNNVNKTNATVLPRISHHAVIWGSTPNCDPLVQPTLKLSCGRGNQTIVLLGDAATCVKVSDSNSTCTRNLNSGHSNATVFFRCQGLPGSSALIATVELEDGAVSSNCHTSDQVPDGSSVQFLTLARFCPPPQDDGNWSMDNDFPCRDGESQFYNYKDNYYCYDAQRCGNASNVTGGNCSSHHLMMVGTDAEGDAVDTCNTPMAGPSVSVMQTLLDTETRPFSLASNHGNSTDSSGSYGSGSGSGSGNKTDSGNDGGGSGSGSRNV
jgi:uncharacterized membrane protein YgcG